MDNMVRRPIIYKKVSDLPRNTFMIDTLESSAKELFFIDNQKTEKITDEIQPAFDRFFEKKKEESIWIYYPWLKKAVNILPEQDYFRLRTNRNKNIILEEEQEVYRNAKVGIAGLSVGSSILSALVISGGPKILKIADFDKIETSNLNRIRANITDIGLNKTEVAARQTWELDPFAELYIWDRGLNKDNMEEFLVSSPRLDVFVDEMDSIDLKVLARIICRRNKIPVVMATDNGDGIILDVERFDKDNNSPLFHGRINDDDLKNIINQKTRTKKEWINLAMRIIGPELMTERHQESILEIGNTLRRPPQLGAAASIAGAATSLAIRLIVNGKDLPAGRYVVSLEKSLILRYNMKREQTARLNKTESFKKTMGI